MIKAPHPFIPLVGFALMLLLATQVADSRPSDEFPRPSTHSDSIPLVHLSDADVDCVGKSSCRAEALKAYRLADHLTDHRDADIANRYMALKHFERSKRLLVTADLDQPDEMSDVTDRQALLQGELDDVFRRARVNYHMWDNHKMYGRMTDQLDLVKAYVPDRQARYHRWATSKELSLKERGVYPRNAQDSF